MRIDPTEIESGAEKASRILSDTGRNTVTFVPPASSIASV